MVRMTGLAPLAILCGLGLGLGLWLLVSLAPRLSRPSLSTRVAPYVTDVSSDARDLLDRQTADPLPVFGAMLEPVASRINRAVTSLLGGNAHTALRLRQAGSTASVEEFRSRQLLWAAAATAIAVVTSLAVGNTQSVPFVAPVAAMLVAAVGGFLARDYLLQRAARARVDRMTKELPTVLEFLTLSLSAGESILDALRRIGRISRGELAAELSSVSREVSTGLPLTDSRDRLSSNSGCRP